MAIQAPAGMLIPREYILQSIEEDLNGIDGNGDYHFTVAEVTRKYQPWHGLSDSQLPMLIVTDKDDVLLSPGPGEQAHNIQREMGAWVWGYIYQADEVHTSRDLCYLLEDVMRCLYVNKQRGTRANGSKLAYFTRFGTIETLEGFATPYGVFRLEVRVTYSYLDPYS